MKQVNRTITKRRKRMNNQEQKIVYTWCLKTSDDQFDVQLQSDTPFPEYPEYEESSGPVGTLKPCIFLNVSIL